MGADGHVFMIPVARIPAQFDGIDPQSLDWRRRDLYGTEVVWRYHDTEGRGESWGLELWEVPDRIDWLRRQIEVRSAPDWRPPTSGWATDSAEKLQGQLDELLAKYTPEQLAEAKRLSELSAWLDANADDWEVWT